MKALYTVNGKSYVSIYHYFSIESFFESAAENCVDQTDKKGGLMYIFSSFHGFLSEFTQEISGKFVAISSGYMAAPEIHENTCTPTSVPLFSSPTYLFRSGFFIFILSDA